jgi:hypothetical protein
VGAVMIVAGVLLTRTKAPVDSPDI